MRIRLLSLLLPALCWSFLSSGQAQKTTSAYKYDPAFDSSTNAFLADLSAFLDSTDVSSANPAPTKETPKATPAAGDQNATPAAGDAAWCKSLEAIVAASGKNFEGFIDNSESDDEDDPLASTTLSPIGGQNVYWDKEDQMTYISLSSNKAEHDALIEATRKCLTKISGDWVPTGRKGEFRSIAHNSIVWVHLNAIDRILLQVRPAH